MGTKRELAEEVWSDDPIHPGETLRAELEVRELSQVALAAKMDRPVRVVNEICQGRRNISAETAWDLEAAMGIPATFWSNLQTRYDLARARLKRLEREVVSPPARA